MMLGKWVGGFPAGVRASVRSPGPFAFWGSPLQVSQLLEI